MIASTKRSSKQFRRFRSALESAIALWILAAAHSIFIRVNLPFVGSETIGRGIPRPYSKSWCLELKSRSQGSHVDSLVVVVVFWVKNHKQTWSQRNVLSHLVAIEALKVVRSVPISTSC